MAEEMDDAPSTVRTRHLTHQAASLRRRPAALPAPRTPLELSISRVSDAPRAGKYPSARSHVNALVQHSAVHMVACSTGWRSGLREGLHGHPRHATGRAQHSTVCRVHTACTLQYSRKRVARSGYEMETERRGAGLQSAEDKLSLQLETKQLGVRTAVCIPVTLCISARRRSQPHRSNPHRRRVERTRSAASLTFICIAAEFQELQESRNELLNRVQSLKKVRACMCVRACAALLFCLRSRLTSPRVRWWLQDLQDWRFKLDDQVKSYRSVRSVCFETCGGDERDRESGRLRHC